MLTREQADTAAAALLAPEKERQDRVRDRIEANHVRRQRERSLSWTIAFWGLLFYAVVAAFCWMAHLKLFPWSTLAWASGIIAGRLIGVRWQR